MMMIKIMDLFFACLVIMIPLLDAAILLYT